MPHVGHASACPVKVKALCDLLATSTAPSTTAVLLPGRSRVLALLQPVAIEFPHIDMLVQIRWQGRKMAVPLSQLDAIDPDESAKEAIGDWHYWISQGCCLSLLSKTGSDTHGGNGNLVVEAPPGRYRQNVKRIARHPFGGTREILECIALRERCLDQPVGIRKLRPYSDSGV